MSRRPERVRVGATLLSEPPEPVSPACWRWKPMTPAIIMGLLEPYPEWWWSKLDAHQQQRALMRGWHRGRCAVCGRTDRSLVEDHSHETGLTRGFLCQSCNVREGYRWHGVYDRYRERNPASILGFRLQYVDPATGIGAQPAPVRTWKDDYSWLDGRIVEQVLKEAGLL